MKPGIHFDPDEIQCPTTEKATIRLLFEMAATHGWNLENMAIVNAYVQELPLRTREIYVRKSRTNPEEPEQSLPMGEIKRNLWGKKSTGLDYIQAIFGFLKRIGYKPDETNP